MKLARIRLISAVVMLAYVWGWHLYYASGDLDCAWDLLRIPLRDPAHLFYPLAVAGLGLRLFWGRYLAICFSLNLLLLAFFRDVAFCHQLLALGAVVPLLAGRSMERLFEGQRRSRFNRWAGADPRVRRLRWLVLLQSLALTLVCCTALGRAVFPPAPRLALIVLLGAGLVGMALQKTWSLFLLAIAALVELPLLAATTGELLDVAAATSCVGWLALVAAGWLIVAAATVGSLVLALPPACQILRRL